ncbi:MAG: hypothetical protein MUF07_14095 [Steroidobacteraceae bacterium]|jgi:hypothetical protein|nr:hypothetical protein [Steroidobacteraceae bacterium]
MKQAQAPLGAEIEGPGRRYFDDVVIDNLLEAMLELTAAVWTHRDRAMVLEQVLSRLLAESHGAPDIARLLEQHRPTAEEQEARRLERDALVSQVFRSFARRPAADSAPLGAGRRYQEPRPRAEQAS